MFMLEAEDYVDLVTRDDVNVPSAPCVMCKTRNRSHILEPPLYEEYKEEVEVTEWQEYQSKAPEEEEPEVIIKYALAEDAKTMCHKCWLKKQGLMSSVLETQSEKWLENMPEHVLKVKKFLKDWKYYQFSREVGEEIQLKVNELKVALKEEYM